MSASITKTEWERLSHKQPKPFTLKDTISTHKPARGSVLVSCRPIITNKGRPMLELQGAAYLDRDQVRLLRDWFDEWLAIPLTTGKL